MMDRISSLQKLKELLEEGVISEEEFLRQKLIILGKKTNQNSSVPISESEDSRLSSVIQKESLYNIEKQSHSLRDIGSTLTKIIISIVAIVFLLLLLTVIIIQVNQWCRG